MKAQRGLMNEINEVQNGEDRTAAIQNAAGELADRLKKLADTLAARQKPTSIDYGPGRLGRWLRRNSPIGFILYPPSLKMLLPDGRLWSYSRSDSTRFPAGRYYDARTDYVQFAGNRASPGGREFVFLGAVIRKYTFGLAHSHSNRHDADPPGLYAMYGEGSSVRYVTADEAIAAIAHSVATDTADTIR